MLSSIGFVYFVAAVTFGGSLLVRWWLKRTYRRWGSVPNQHGVTGAQTAAAILQNNGLGHVAITGVKGALTDHYDPQRDILRLSASNYAGTSVAAMAVAAHEAGHALQDGSRDFRLTFRRYLVPLAALGSRFGPLVAVWGMMTASETLLRIGVFLLAGMMLFQIATLPVEFNASRRAMTHLERLGLSDPQQQDGVRQVLRAAAFTYVAAAASTIAYVAFLLGRSRSSSRA